ncbi:hypothetical protein DX914_16030 [Lysobacter silvisoli]|uniref:Uncharacterized protein n=2 Tax=Lysobacter silvisoli TaxID=2293254 RepID=A0A371JXV3_9GAMM|nr:hypothetical protein DX914_16030 [Lysobacter silvisoli]
MAGSIAACLPIQLGEYLALVEWTARQVRPDKRGASTPCAPAVLRRIEPHSGRWAVRVKAIGSGYWRVVGDVEDLVERAANLGQRWLKGLGLAKALTYER